MKTLLISLIFSFLIPIWQIYSQWIQQNSGTNKDLYNVYFLNNQLGWICGDEGTLLKTTNGGIDWVAQNAGTLDAVRDIFFIDSLTGWAVLREFEPYRTGKIIHTTNSGDSWFVQLSINDFALLSIHFTNEMNGWVAGTNGIVFHTTNGGSTWFQQYPNTQGGWLLPIFFIDNNVGWTAGDARFGIFKSTNGGNSWQSINISFVEQIYSMTFIDHNTGWVAGPYGQISKSTNGGINWANLQSGTSEYLRDIFFTDINNGWCICENGTILHTTNSGLNWYSEITSTNSVLHSVYFVTNDIGWIAGFNGVTLKRDPDLNFINLTFPNGGEILTTGSTYFIEWVSQNVEDVSIQYSTNSRNNWITIIDSLPSTGIYEWTIPNTLTSEGRVKITDLSDTDVYDISEADFTIQSSIIINVVSPNGRETLEGGSNYEILWSSNDVEDVKLEYSINNGASWNMIIDSTGSTGIFIWNVPNVLTTQARVKISDINNSSIYDVSDGVFRINHTVGVNEDNRVETFNLEQNYPNPFNSSTLIRYSIKNDGLVHLKVYDILGREIGIIVDSYQQAGIYEVMFDGTYLSSGIYYYKLDSNNHSLIKKLILIR